MPLFTGSNVRQKGDQLHLTDPLRLAERIHATQGPLYDLVSQLRYLRELDAQQYRGAKTNLPYFVGASFYPAARHRDNFTSIEYFTVDLDHFDTDEAPDLETVRQELQQREDVVLLFRSPSGHGLKAVFRLAEACSEPGLYRLFYQQFVQGLVQRYQLQAVVDTVTHDVSRVCFLSHDPEVYCQPDASLVVLGSVVDLDHPFLPEQVQQAVASTAASPLERPSGGPDEEALLAIKQRLNSNYRPKRQVSAQTPERLNDLLDELERMLLDNGIETLISHPIQYGRQLRLGMGHYWAEVNMFYGKKGFSVVKTAKSGSQPDLAELCTRLLHEYLISQS